MASFPNGSAGGMDGLHPQLLKDMVSPVTGANGPQLIQNLAALSTIIAAGNLPLPIREFLFGARLVGLAKKDGGIRPIAIGNILRRVICKAACSNVKEKVTALLAPKQLGFGLSMGAEGADHAARRFLQNSLASDDPLILLKIDFSNAFNSLRRDHMLERVKATCPEIYNLVLYAYDDPSILLYQSITLASAEGVQQGDPLAVLLFCIAIQPLVASMTSDFNVWYCDDGTLGGPQDTVLQDYERIKTLGAEMGLTLNIQKTELTFLNSNQDCFDTVKDSLTEQFGDVLFVKPDGQTLLGAAIGGHKAIEQVLNIKIEMLELLCKRLKRLDAHDALFLLAASFSLPRLMYVLRTTPCYESNLLQRYDKTVRECLESILNIKLSGASYEQATLPVKHGGLGIRRATDLTLPTFISSVKASKDVTTCILQKCNQVRTEDPKETQAVDLWKARSGAPTPASTAQKSWDEPLVLLRRDALVGSAADDVTRARLTGVTASGAGAWLQALPSHSLGLKLTNEQIRIATGLRLGCDLCTEHRCIRCGHVVDTTGHHGLHCAKGSAGRASRHAEANNLLSRSLTSANTPNMLEPRNVSRDDGKRPDGMTMIPWKTGRMLVWDFTCTDTLAPSYLQTALRGPGYVADAAEQRKTAKYRQLGDKFFFVPVGVETLGGWGSDANAFIKDLGRRLAKITFDKRSTAFLRQRLSIAIQRGNATSVLGTLPQGESLEQAYTCLFSDPYTISPCP